MKDPSKMSERELRKELCQTRRLLVLANCPDENCGGQGFTVVPDDYGEAMQQQCQWCDERRTLIE